MASALSFFALYHSSLKRPPLFIHFHISNPNPPVSHNLPLCPLTKNHPRTKIFCFRSQQSGLHDQKLTRSCSTAQEVTVETTPEENQEANLKRKLFVANLPWSFSVVNIKDLYVEAAIDKFNSHACPFSFLSLCFSFLFEVSGRIIRVEFAKQLRRLPPPHPPGIAAGTPAGETRHKLYISNLAWKVRGSHLREFLSTNFNPISRYGFVSFATKEEAEASTSSLNGKGYYRVWNWQVDNLRESENEKK
ncbi:ribonucleoprotein [Salix suchowensis]|nr:ribonucleoprotein [Salix suchowensis]